MLLASGQDFNWALGHQSLFDSGHRPLTTALLPDCLEMSIFQSFPRGASAKRSCGPSAEFASEETARNAPLRFSVENEEGRIFLGLIDAVVEQLPSDQSAGGRPSRYASGGDLVGVLDDRHIITVAGSRAGKGRSAIVPNLLTYPGSMLVIDPKGDLARLTATRRIRMGHRVHVLDPFNVSGVARAYPGTFNPLRLLHFDSPTLVEDAGLIADSLVIKEKGEKDPHWNESARRLIETLVLHVATDPGHEGRRDLVSVSDLLDRAAEPAIVDELEQNSAARGAVQAGAMDFFLRPETERSSVLSTARRHVRFLGYEQMQAALRDEGSIDPGDLKRTKTTIFLSLPAMRMGTCSRWLRLFVNLSLAQMEAVQERPEHPVLFCLDEFAVLGHMKTIEDAAGQLAGLGVKLWPILQDLTQLKALYGDRWETFLGNAGIVQLFGNSDLTTLEWISKRLGETTIINKSKSDPGYLARTTQGAKGESYSEAVHPLMTAEEASRFFGRDDPMLRQLVIRPSHAPLVLQRAYYDKHPCFKGLLL